MTITCRAASGGHDDYLPDNEWTFDNGRWGWSMTEKLPGQFWHMHYLRTGRRDVFFQAEAIAANSRDVVVRHHGRWFGRGTRHGVQHWSCGNHEERQTVSLEWRPHYLLTGDCRSADVIERLTRDHYLATRVSGTAAPSGRLPGLLMHWEVTGDPASREAFDSYLRAMIVSEGIQLPTVDMRTGEKLSDGAINNPTMFFHTFGAMHAILEYYYLSEDEDLREALREALIRAADHFVATDTLYAGGKVIGFAAKHADDPDTYLQVWDNNLHNSRGWQYLFHTVTSNPAHWSGPTALLTGAATTSWSRLNKVPYWTSVWDQAGHPQKPNASQISAMAEREKRGNPVNPDRVRQLDWQDAYDDPKFDAYFERWRPWSEAFVHPTDYAAQK